MRGLRQAGRRGSLRANDLTRSLLKVNDLLENVTERHLLEAGPRPPGTSSREGPRPSAAALREPKLRKSLAEEASFATIANTSGLITLQDAMAYYLSQGMSYHLARSIMNELDANGDQSISRSEWFAGIARASQNILELRWVKRPHRRDHALMHGLFAIGCDAIEALALGDCDCGQVDATRGGESGN